MKSYFALTAVVLLCGYAIRQVRARGLDRWIIPYLARGHRPRSGPRGPIHVLICIADHFEPRAGGASAGSGAAQGREMGARLSRAVRQFPRQRRADAPPHVLLPDRGVRSRASRRPGRALPGRLRRGRGASAPRQRHGREPPQDLAGRPRNVFARRHGLLSRDRRTGQLAYGFIHGNWALDNSRPDGRWCGVNNELDVLRETGCYADFTFPSAPSPTQPRKINSIYYAVDDPHRPRSHDRGIDVGRAPAPPKGLMLIQGPLVLNWRHRRWGLIPRTENGCLQASQPPHIDRLDLWLKARVQVPTRPDWFFVKLHAHGAYEYGHEAVLGEPMVRFHRDLADRARRDPSFHYHYVTAREMYNLVKAAEEGWQGTVADALDYHLVWVGHESLNKAPT